MESVLSDIAENAPCFAYDLYVFGRAGSSPVGSVHPPCLPEIDATVQLPLSGAEPEGSTSGVAVAQLHGCRGIKAWLDTLDGLDTVLGKFSIERFIEEFPDLVSRVSEVSSDLVPG
jgi:hypothetical protein